MIDVIGIGELLIDFTPVLKDGEKPCYEQNPGGAPPNVLAMVSKLGGRAAFIGKVGKDKFGDYLVKTLEEFNIDTSGVVYSKSITTTLAFVHLDSNGERSFSFCRNPGADLLLEENEVDYSLIDKCNIFHFGSLSFTDEPARTTVLKAVQYAKQNNKIISYDPNYRPALWKTEKAAVEGMRIGLGYADILKLSEEEAILLTGKKDYKSAADYLVGNKVKLVLITIGEKGSYYANSKSNGLVDSFKVKCIDTTGAGDAFMGSMLFKLSKSKKRIEDLSKENITEMLRHSNACAALCVGARGGIPSMPTNKSISHLLRITLK